MCRTDADAPAHESPFAPESPMRAKTTRRLLILGGIVFGIAAISMTIWIVSSRKAATRIAKAREGAMAAYAKGDYVAALPLFSQYLTETRTAEKAPGKADVEALLAYGKSRLAIPLPRGQHLRGDGGRGLRGDARLLHERARA